MYLIVLLFVSSELFRHCKGTATFITNQQKIKLFSNVQINTNEYKCRTASLCKSCKKYKQKKQQLSLLPLKHRLIVVRLCSVV